MPEVKQHYNNMTERQSWIAHWQSQGYRMLHDDFDDPNWKQGDPEVGTVTFTDEPEPEPVTLEPPRSGHPAQLVAVGATKARPARVKRIWGGKKYFYNCLATETVVAEYQAGKIVIGDYLWVEFLNPSEEIGGGEQIVIGKVRKTW